MIKQKKLMKFKFRRIFCRCSSTIVGIAESMLRVCRMLDKEVELTVVEQAELRFGQVAAVAVGMRFAQRVLGL